MDFVHYFGDWLLHCQHWQLLGNVWQYIFLIACLVFLIPFFRR